MLVIRKAQWEALDKALRHDDFLTRLQAEMTRTYPEECARIGDKGVRERIEKGIRQTRAHQIREPVNITRYLHLMFLFQTDDLDTSPETAWARNILEWEDADEDFRLAALERRGQKEYGM
jgi:hypothetical protein